MSPKVMIIAGEASGDLHGAFLVREMLLLNPRLRFYGIGGDKMQREGVELLAHAADIAVVGISEVFAKIATFFKIIRRLKKTMDALRPELVILIDFPDFNLNIAARAAKKRNLKVFYYISPQVWAWRSGRVKQIKKLVDRMAVILPFEEEFYATRGFPVSYVGHPLRDIVQSAFSPSQARLNFGLAEKKTTIGLLPGSRTSEVTGLLPEMASAAKILSQKLTNVQYILPLADTLKESWVAGMLADYGVDVKIVQGSAYDALACCDLAMVASGTATLETGLMGVPMVIIYKVSLFSELIARMIIKPQRIGMVNIIAGKTVAPELLQKDACGARIAEEALAILNNEEKKQNIIKELKLLRAKLGEPGAPRRAAQMACGMMADSG